MVRRSPTSFFFFFNDTATTEIYTLSLHDALPISFAPHIKFLSGKCQIHIVFVRLLLHFRSEEHTSELQSQSNLVCRLLLEKKKSNSTPCARALLKRRAFCSPVRHGRTHGSMRLSS